MKKVISILMCLCLILSTFTFVGISASAESYSGSCGDNVTWSLDTETGEFTVSGTGDMYDYGIDLAPSWYSYQSYIKSIIIENGVTSIGEEAFIQLKSLTDVIIGESVTSIDNSAFYDCNSLTSVTIYNSEIVIGNYALSDCSIIYGYTGSTAETYANEHDIEFETLTIVENEDDYLYTVLDDNTIRITEYSGTASKIKIPSEIGGKKVTKISWDDDSISNDNADWYSGAFENCESLVSVIIPDSIKSIGYSTFRNCTSLKSVVIGNSVTNIDSFAFYECGNLENVEIGDSVESIGKKAFGSCCWSLNSIILPDSVKSIGEDAFSHCYELENITLSNSLTNIGEYAFSYCKSLENITMPDSVISIASHAFSSCDSLTSITVSDDNNVYCDVDGVLFNKAKAELIQYPIGNSKASYSIPDSVTSIGDYAFKDCKSLTSITIPNSVTSIGYSAFSSCSLLLNITLPDSITSIGSSAFYDTAYYNDDESWENNVLYIGNYLIKANTSIFGSYTINEGVKTIADSAFSNCTKLTNVTIPESVTSIGYCVFYNCLKLTSITIPESVTSIDSKAFYGCQSLTSITIPDSVTSIGSSAFKNCSKLTSITIPDSVTSIGDEAFGYYYNEEIDDYVIVDGFIIYGYTGSAAETYANDNNITFVALDGKTPNEPSTDPTTPTQPTAPTTPTTPSQNINTSGTGTTTNKPTTGTIKAPSSAQKVVLNIPNLKATGAKGKLNITYKKVSGASGFQVRYKIKGKWKVKTYNTSKSVKKVIKKLKKGTYKVQIRSFAKSGTQKTYSKWSKTQKVKVK